MITGPTVPIIEASLAPVIAQGFGHHPPGAAVEKMASPTP